MSVISLQNLKCPIIIIFLISSSIILLYRFTLQLQNYLITQSGNPNLGILLYIDGGSYFRSAALIDCVKNYMRKLDWFTMHSLDRKIGSAWDAVPAVLFHLSHYKTAYWPSVCGRPVLYKHFYNKECKSATIMHKNVGNPPKALYVHYSQTYLLDKVHFYEDLFKLDLSKINRNVTK
jgi:hypothetical protein